MILINILDVMDEIEIPEDGKFLQRMFARQEELMRKYIASKLAQTEGIDINSLRVDIHSKLGQIRIREFMEYAIEELMEAANTLRNKPWQRTERRTDENHFYEELSDMIHFLLELFMMVGLDAEKLYKLYIAKSAVNRFRQQSDY